MTQKLRSLVLNLRLRSDSLVLHSFSGQLWRSGFGASLARTFPGVFSDLFGHDESPGKLYALEPPSRPVMSGEHFMLKIKLFGDCVRHAVSCTQAISQLGQFGLSDARMRFTLLEASVDQAPPFWSLEQGIMGFPVAQEFSEDSVRLLDRAVCIEFLSPLRIKEQNKPYLGPISFEMLIRRIYGRLAQLAEESGAENPIERPQYLDLLDQARHIQLVAQSDAQTKLITRTSARTGQKMAFAGIVGRNVYQGDLAPFSYPLQWAERVQVGGKTTFGFGCIQYTATST